MPEPLYAAAVLLMAAYTVPGLIWLVELLRGKP